MLEKLPNLDPWISQSSSKNEKPMIITAMNKLENDLLSLKDEHKKRIRPNLHATYNEYHEKFIELIDWTLETYTTAVVAKDVLIKLYNCRKNKSLKFVEIFFC